LRTIESIDEADGRVVVKLHPSEMPELMGEADQRAACWLLREEGKVSATG